MEERKSVTLRILLTEPDAYSPIALSRLRELGEVDTAPVSQSDLAERLKEVDILLVRLGLRITSEVIERAERLLAVVSPTTGLDHIDVDAARAKGIEVLSLQGETHFLRNIPATAEHTWALLLALNRNIPWAFDSVRSGRWDRVRFRGKDLSGRRLGILGLGRLGEMVASYGHAFGMAVGGYDPYRETWAENVYRFSTLAGLLRSSDILTVHVPLSKGTTKLLSTAELDLLPRGAVIVNTSRGEVIDEAALLRALDRRHLAGAAVDVVAGEPAAVNEQHPLVAYARAHDHLLITPHLGGATVESMHKTEEFMVEKLISFLRCTASQTGATDV